MERQQVDLLLPWKKLFCQVNHIKIMNPRTISTDVIKIVNSMPISSRTLTFLLRIGNRL